MPNPRRGVCSKEAPKHRTPREASPAEVWGKFFVLRGERRTKVRRTSKTEKVNKKNNKIGRKTEFSNLNTLTNTNKEKEEAYTKHLSLFLFTVLPKIGGASARKRHQSKERQGRQAPPRFVQKSSADGREAYIGTPRTETAIVNKKPNKNGRKTEFSNLNTLPIPHKEK